MSLGVLYGGTFDPVHAGHLAVARAARDRLGAEVALLPANDPPHRPPPGASALQRRHMLELAIADEVGLRIDDRELHRPGRSYTVDTLRELRAEHDSRPLAWLLGDDSFRDLAGWHDWTALFGLTHFVVALRPGHRLDNLPAPLAEATAGRWLTDATELRTRPAGGLFRLALPAHPASATAVRARLAAGDGAGDWLAPSVAAFICDQGLYRAPPASPGV